MSSSQSPDKPEENIEAELRKLQLSIRDLKRTYNDLRNRNDARISLMYHDRLIRVIEEMLKVTFVKKKKVVLVLENYRKNLVEIGRRIESKQTKPTRKRKKKRPRLSFLINDEFFRKANGKQSFYFRCGSSSLQHDHSDFNEIISVGHKFLNCLTYSNSWRLSDADKLTAGIRTCLIREKLMELQTVFDKINEVTKVNPFSKELKALRERSDYLNNFLLNAEDVNFVDLLKQEREDHDFDWNFISSKYFRFHHASADCQRMWHLVAKPSICKNAWTASEDLLLREITIENGFQNWSEINRQLSTNRSEFLCFTRYQTMFRVASRNIPKVWTEEENAEIEKLLDAESSSTNLIFKMCEKFRELSRTQILTHMKYLSCIRHKKKGLFSQRERFLIDFYTSRGYSYPIIAQMLGNRTSKQIRDYHISFNRKQRHGTWTKKEIRDLLKSVKYIGEGKWTKVSHFIKGRSPMQCRQKFLFLKRKRKDLIENVLTKSLAGTKRKLKDIKSLLRKKEMLQNSRNNRKNSIDEKIELYFVKKLEQRSGFENKLLMGKRILSLLNFLKFEVNLGVISSDKIGDSLIEYSSSLTRQENRNVFQNLSLVEPKKKSVMNYCKGNSVFSHVLHRYYNVIPPNQCCIYGFHTFMESYESFAKTNSNINFEKLWKKIDFNLKKNKDFIEAKIQWFRILKAIFYWSIKLKHITTEQVLKNL